MLDFDAKYFMLKYMCMYVQNANGRETETNKNKQKGKHSVTRAHYSHLVFVDLAFS